jgi:hypothetical protein
MWSVGVRLTMIQSPPRARRRPQNSPFTSTTLRHSASLFQNAASFSWRDASEQLRAGHSEQQTVSVWQKMAKGFRNGVA